MSIKDSIMNMFNPSGGATITGNAGQVNPTPVAPANSNMPAPGAAQQTPTQAANAGVVQTPGVTQQNNNTAPNGVVPTGADTPPLASFKDLWEPVPIKKDAQGNPVIDPSQQPILNIDPKKIMEAAKGTDFRALITSNPELMKRVAAGGADGQTAMLEAINIAAQAALGQSATTAANLMQGALKKAEEQFVAKIPEIIRRAQTTNDLRGEDARFDNPAAKPIVQALSTQFAQKFPQATPQEITAHVKSYLTEFAQTFTPAPPAPVKVPGARDAVDWDSLMFGNTQ